MAVYICKKCGWVMGYIGEPAGKCAVCNIDLILTDLDDFVYASMSDYETDQYRRSYQPKEQYDEQAWQQRIEYDTNRISRLRQEASEQPPRADCPYCKSRNTKKIPGYEKAVDTGLFGMFGTKRYYQWHCNNCNSDF